MARKQIISALLGMLVLSCTSEIGSAASTFNVNAEGWTVADFSIPVAFPDFVSGPVATNSLVYQAVGGNPGGFVSSPDPNNLWQYFLAPGVFLGNQSAVLGGVLTFDLTRLDTQSISVLSPTAPLAAITDGTTVLVYSGTYTLPTLSTWTSYTVPFEVSSWRITDPNGAVPTNLQLATVLSNLTGLYIAADFWAGAGATGEEVGLDNVALTPNPEPSSWMLGIIGFAAIVGIRKSRSRA